MKDLSGCVRQTTAQPARFFRPTAKAIKLAHPIFRMPNLEAETSLRDFGLIAAERGRQRILVRAALPRPQGASSASSGRTPRRQPAWLKALSALPGRGPMTLNVEGQRPRANAGQRPAMESPHILELGRVVRDSPIATRRSAGAPSTSG
ncbi:hypothetical protein [Streptomyces sp. NPDC058335]|uniref:hypothetical protein n=1 Tax=Streptomyces sp. NPDC058335 TaxID=3346451 RepID=UPI00365E9BDC